MNWDRVVGWRRRARAVMDYMRDPMVVKYMGVSFSGYGEDHILFHLHPQRRGFYVEVGAFQPRRASNTYKLYLRGWRGITIEPNPDVATSFKKVRPRDTHLAVGVSKSATTLTYHRFTAPTINSFVPDWQQASGIKIVDRIPIACATLSDILDEHCPEQRVDLLSIDCEGHDMEVLESLDWSRYRPTVVILEDMDEFFESARRSERSPMRSFMVERDYCLASQTVFSFFYVDRHAFSKNNRRAGFRLSNSQITGLALPD